jgi:ParB family chromosome partitioning protein
LNNQYQLFPDLTEAEFAELKADIAERGVMVPIEYDDAGNILDGHHRKRACDELGIKDFRSIIRYGWTEQEKRLHVRKLNLARRHLTESQKRTVIADALKDAPEKSNRQHGRELGVDDKTVGSVREKLESTAEIPQLSKTVGADGKSRTTKPKNGNAPRPSLFTETAEQRERATEPAVAERIASGAVSASNKLNIGGAHVEKNSGENEWYTPVVFLDAARKAMGRIDLDPASSEVAQRTVKAKRYYTRDDDGLKQEWKGRVWMNPPYAKDLCGQFVGKLLAETGVTQAIVLVNNATETAWAQPLLRRASAVCFPSSRIRFLSPDDKVGSPLQGQMIVYIGDRVTEFRDNFAAFGAVLGGAT